MLFMSYTYFSPLYKKIMLKFAQTFLSNFFKYIFMQNQSKAHCKNASIDRCDRFWS